MGEWFTIWNHTRRVILKPAWCNWKDGEWDWEEVIRVMGWSRSDEIDAYGDGGSILRWNGGDIQFEEFDFEAAYEAEMKKQEAGADAVEDTRLETTPEEPYTRKYLHGDEILDQPLQAR